jgi:GNAT superfamily N-acetyltransferase
MVIRELLTKEELRASFHVMNQLRPSLTEESYFTLYNEMKQQGYQLMALYNEEMRIVSLAGFAIRVNLYDLKHIYIYDLITDQNERSKGYGEQLLGYIEELAREQGCSNVVLSSGLWRTDAHRFYEHKLNYDKTSYVFKKAIE